MDQKLEWKNKIERTIDDEKLLGLSKQKEG